MTAQGSSTSLTCLVDKSTVDADGGDTVTITATVTDGCGNPRANYPVSFSANGGDLAAASGVTDGSGVATTTWNTIDPGTFTLTVIDGNDPANLANEVVQAVALEGKFLRHEIDQAPPYRRFVNYDFKWTWDSMLMRGKPGVNPPLVLRYRWIKPDGTPLDPGWNQLGVRLKGTATVTQSFGIAGGWKLESELYLRNANGTPDMSRVAATAPPVHQFQVDP